ncbi:MAG TPA: hypothetical protein VFU42_03710, partial [Candidatus Deferrimicrobiaceae bacterium]|nr:hypothetical protein [Candidatus Deferrimicrobiaceae bacterium]
MRTRFERKWVLRNPDNRLVREIREATGLSEPSARILVNRGIVDPLRAKEFLSGTLREVTSPFRMKDLEKAAARVVEAGLRNEKVLIYADYDVDGATGAAVLRLFLGEVFPGLTVRVHQNHRVHDGYGLRVPHLAAAAEEG